VLVHTVYAVKVLYQGEAEKTSRILLEITGMTEEEE
jgi:hydrogenase maturation factor